MIHYSANHYPTIEELDPSDPQVYARINGSVVTEYPVYDYNIVNREHAFELYTPVKYETYPEVPTYHFVQECPKVTQDNAWVIVGYSNPIPYSLDALFNAAATSTQLVEVEQVKVDQPETLDTEVSDVETNVPIQPPIDAVKPEPIFKLTDYDLECRIFQAIKDRVQDHLDIFAKSRDYSNILSAVSYEGSSNPKRNEEAVYCKVVRDATWDALYAFQTDVLNESKSFPQCWDDVAVHLPLLQWPHVAVTVSDTTIEIPPLLETNSSPDESLNSHSTIDSIEGGA